MKRPGVRTFGFREIRTQKEDLSWTEFVKAAKTVMNRYSGGEKMSVFGW